MKRKTSKESTDELMVASFDNGSLTGFLCLKETGRDTVELSVMGVLKEYHRNGIGRALFETAYENRIVRIHYLGAIKATGLN